MPELRHLRNFLVLADELHFTRAAKRLHLAQAALSQSIRQLEEEIGAPLVVRTTRRVGLTEAGRAFSEHARLTLQTLERGITSTVRIARESEKVVVFGFTSDGMYGRLPMLIRHFRQQEKDTRLVFREYTADALVAALKGGHVELGVLHGHLTDPVLTSAVIEREGCVLAIPSGHRLSRSRTAITFEELKAEENVLVPPKTAFHGLYEEIEAACTRADVVLAMTPFSPSAQALIGLVAAAMGVAIVPSSIALPREGVVYRDLAADEPIAVEKRLYWHRGTQSRAVEVFLALLRPGSPKG
jgi:DNA-binding transcriptional LysR family regulator